MAARRLCLDGCMRICAPVFGGVEAASGCGLLAGKRLVMLPRFWQPPPGRGSSPQCKADVCDNLDSEVCFCAPPLPGLLPCLLRCEHGACLPR